MNVGAIAKILKNMFLVDKGRSADPIDPFGTHMGKGDGVVIGHPHRQGVAADTSHGETTFRRRRAAVMWTTGAIMRHTKFFTWHGNSLLFAAFYLRQTLFDDGMVGFCQ